MSVSASEFTLTDSGCRSRQGPGPGSRSRSFSPCSSLTGDSTAGWRVRIVHSLVLSINLSFFHWAVTQPTRPSEVFTFPFLRLVFGQQRQSGRAGGPEHHDIPGRGPLETPKLPGTLASPSLISRVSKSVLVLYQQAFSGRRGVIFCIETILL